MRCKAFTDGAHVQLCSGIVRARGSARRTGVERSKVRATAALSAPASHEINTVSDTRKKISMMQLGCPKNTVDGERFTFSACVTDTDVALCSVMYLQAGDANTRMRVGRHDSSLIDAIPFWPQSWPSSALAPLSIKILRVM